MDNSKVQYVFIEARKAGKRMNTESKQMSIAAIDASLTEMVANGRIGNIEQDAMIAGIRVRLTFTNYLPGAVYTFHIDNDELLTQSNGRAIDYIFDHQTSAPAADALNEKIRATAKRVDAASVSVTREPCQGECGKHRSVIFSDSPSQWLCYDCRTKASAPIELNLLQSLQDAVTIINSARKDVASGSLTIWRIANHASIYLDKQIAELLA